MPVEEADTLSGFSDERFLFSCALLYLNGGNPFVGYANEVQHLRQIFFDRAGRTACLIAIHPD